MHPAHYYKGWEIKLSHSSDEYGGWLWLAQCLEQEFRADNSKNFGLDTQEEAIQEAYRAIDYYIDSGIGVGTELNWLVVCQSCQPWKYFGPFDSASAAADAISDAQQKNPDRQYHLIPLTPPESM